MTDEGERIRTNRWCFEIKTLGIVAHNEGKIAEEQTQLSVKTAERTIRELPELFADEPLALKYVEEAIQNARSSLAQLGLEELLDSTESGE